MYVLSITNPRRPGVSYQGRSGFVTRVRDAVMYHDRYDALAAGKPLTEFLSLDDLVSVFPADLPGRLMKAARTRSDVSASLWRRLLESAANDEPARGH